MKNLIREFRQLRGFTQRQLADLVHVSVNAISDYELNKYQPRADVIDKLLFYLGCNFNQLFIRETYQQLDFHDICNSHISCNYHPEDKEVAQLMLSRIMAGSYSDVL